jgi:hypothetical protein
VRGEGRWIPEDACGAGSHSTVARATEQRDRRDG